jgi:hypothetical protein
MRMGHLVSWVQELHFRVVRIPFTISREAYLTIQPAVATQWTKRRGSVWLKLAAILCGGIGLVLLFHHLLEASGKTKTSSSEYALSVTLILAGGVALAGLFYLPRMQARRIERDYRQILLERYDRLHCRDRRYLETSEEGFLFGCDCQRTRYAWPQLVSLVESNDVFVIRTKDNIEVVPKPAFPNEAAITEFRRLLTDHMDRPDALQARVVQVKCTPSDLRWARWLHIRKGGGWRAMLAPLGSAAAFSMCVGYFAQFVDSTIRWDRLLWAECAALGLLLLMLRLGRRTPHYLGPFRVWFDDQALHLEYPFSLVRVEWYRLWAFLDDKHNLLLYHSDHSYWTVPQRFIDASQGEYVRSLVRAKLRRA